MTNEQRLLNLHRLMELDNRVFIVGKYLQAKSYDGQNIQVSINYIKVQLTDDKYDCFACLLDSGEYKLAGSNQKLLFERGDLRSLISAPDNGGWVIIWLPLLPEVIAEYDDRIVLRIKNLEEQREQITGEITDDGR